MHFLASKKEWFSSPELLLSRTLFHAQIHEDEDGIEGDTCTACCGAGGGNTLPMTS